MQRNTQRHHTQNYTWHVIQQQNWFNKSLFILNCGHLFPFCHSLYPPQLYSHVQISAVKQISKTIRLGANCNVKQVQAEGTVSPGPGTPSSRRVTLRTHTEQLTSSSILTVSQKTKTFCLHKTVQTFLSAQDRVKHKSSLSSLNYQHDKNIAY